MRIDIRNGLDIPLSGTPSPEIDDTKPVRTVAVLGRDYRDLKPTFKVTEGDRVSLGQPLFTSKKHSRIAVTSPGCGEVIAIHRGARRSLQSVEIRLDGDEEVTFRAHPREDLPSLSRDQVRETLLDAGLWTAFRTRPYGKLPPPRSVPAALFVTAMDTNPLAANAENVINRSREDFVDGLTVLGHLTGGPLFVCKSPGSLIPTGGSMAKVAEFGGPHPAGLPGTHIHFLFPAGPRRTVWHIGYQDVIAIGRLFTSGRLSVERIVAMGGPPVRQPRLIRSRLGASLHQMVEDELEDVECRVISGSVLAGHRASGPVAFLGRHHQQVSVLREGREREFLGWLRPGRKKFSAINIFVSSLLRPRGFALSTSQNGSPRAMVPIGAYERVMPLDVLATPLLRALLVRDTETAQALGCLELDDEDLALCSFVCPGKHDFGPVLRANLELIEREG